jgi:hypothetical protein
VADRTSYRHGTKAAVATLPVAQNVDRFAANLDHQEPAAFGSQRFVRDGGLPVVKVCALYQKNRVDATTAATVFLAALACFLVGFLAAADFEF